MWADRCMSTLLYVSCMVLIFGIYTAIAIHFSVITRKSIHVRKTENILLYPGDQETEATNGKCTRRGLSCIIAPSSLSGVFGIVGRIQQRGGKPALETTWAIVRFTAVGAGKLL